MHCRRSDDRGGRPAHRRGARAPAGLSRQPRAGEHDGARARPRHQFPAGAPVVAPSDAAAGVARAASVTQTIPGLALLALFYPLLLALAALCERLFGAGFSALGFLPSVLALALYSMLPVLRNTITGLQGVDPAIKEAALGVGMTRRQSLIMVELPLALPVIMAGIRTAAVWVIGTATLSTPIGQTSLGNYIFTGLQTQNWVFVLFGCVAAAVLALAVDQLLALMESGAARRSRRSIALGAVGLALLVGRRSGAVAGTARRLCHRRQAIFRAIRLGRPDATATRGGRIFGRPP